MGKPQFSRMGKVFIDFWFAMDGNAFSFFLNGSSPSSIAIKSIRFHFDLIQYDYEKNRVFLPFIHVIPDLFDFICCKQNRFPEVLISGT